MGYFQIWWISQNGGGDQGQLNKQSSPPSLVHSGVKDAVDARLKVLLIYFTQWILRIILAKYGILDDF